MTQRKKTRTEKAVKTESRPAKAKRAKSKAKAETVEIPQPEPEQNLPVEESASPEESNREQESCTVEELLEAIIDDENDEPETDDSWADKILAQYDRTLEEKGLGEDYFRKIEKELEDWEQEKKESEALIEKLLNEED
ncbi:hypothetical protein [Bacteroides gallinarum]|uniref:hypothetical protein n=1 Tax=Bacteroides gallinarum TaxID=376806 RepID=UPI0003732E8F|nr:hypothetical protein [Bacteroides gallinarum]